MSIFHWHVDSTCFHYCNEVKTPCGKQAHNHPCLRLHSHGRSKFWTFNAIASEVFTSEDVKVGDWNALHVDVKQYKLPLSLMWNNWIYYFLCNLCKHKGIIVMTCLCTKLVIVLNYRNIIVVHAIGLLHVLHKT